MASYASFENFIDKDYDISKFVERFFGDAYCMAKTYEGLVFHYETGASDKIMVKDLEKVFIGSDHIYFKFKKVFDVAKGESKVVRMDMVIVFDSIRKIQVLPPAPERWG